MIRSIRLGIASLGLALVLSGCLAKQEAIETDLGKVGGDVQRLGERLSRVESRVKKLGDDVERTERTMGQTRADQSVMIEDLKIENKNLQGSIEVLRHDLEEALAENKKLREDFDYRIVDLEKKLSGMNNNLDASSTSKSATSNLSDSARYTQAMNLFQKKKSYPQAAAMFRSIVQDFPKGKWAASAQYWVGESYFAQKKYTEAIREYQQVVDRYPQHEKSCDATYKQAQAFMAIKKTDSAKDFLTEALDRCKTTAMKKKIQSQLKRLNALSKK